MSDNDTLDDEVFFIFTVSFDNLNIMSISLLWRGISWMWLFRRPLSVSKCKVSE